MFFAIFNFNALITGPLTGFLIDKVSKSTFYWIIFGIACLGAFFFSVLTPPKKYTVSHQIGLDLINKVKAQMGTLKQNAK